MKAEGRTGEDEEGAVEGTNERKLWLMYQNKDNASSVHAKRNFRLFYLGRHLNIIKSS